MNDFPHHCVGLDEEIGDKAWEDTFEWGPDSINVISGNGFDDVYIFLGIEYCPYCGEKLVNV